MFLIAITQSPIQARFNHAECTVNKIKIESFLATIVIDNYLSQYSENATGFSIIESLLPDIKDIVLLEILYDKNKNVLSVFKPTLSGRPIYYHINSNGEFYCSTNISMLRKAGVIIKENISVLPEFFVYRYITPPKTLYENINQLSIGSKLHIALINGRCNVESEHKYNPFSIKSGIFPESISTEGIIEQIHINLTQSINHLSPCRERLSVLLSGGLDSSILFAICKDAFGISESYSTSYPFENVNNDIERKYAVSAAKALESDNHFYEADNNEFLNGFLEAISTAEEPIHHLQSVMFHLLFKKGLSQDKDIVVSGQGADGAFGLGLHNQIYNHNNRNVVSRLLSRGPLFSIVKAASRITGRGSGFINNINIKDNIYKELGNPSSIIYSMGNYGSEDWVCNYFNVRREDIIKNRYESIKQFEQNSIYDVISMLDIIGDVSITQSIWSKLAEGNGKILYYPFNSNELLNNTFSIEWEAKLKQPKNILRGVARVLHIPEFIIKRPKSGFGIAPNRWAVKGGVFDPLVPLASKCFDKSIILGMQSVEPKCAMTFWNILNYSIWKRICIDNEPLDVLREELSRCISDSNQ